MKVYISVDVEGLTGSTSWESTNLGNLEHGAVAEQMKREAMAAALGLLMPELTRSISKMHMTADATWISPVFQNSAASSATGRTARIP